MSAPMFIFPTAIPTPQESHCVLFRKKTDRCFMSEDNLWFDRSTFSIHLGALSQRAVLTTVLVDSYINSTSTAEKQWTCYLGEVVLWQSGSIACPFHRVVATVLELPFQSSVAILSSLLNHVQVLVDLCQVIQSMRVGFFKSGKKTTVSLNFFFFLPKCTLII